MFNLRTDMFFAEDGYSQFGRLYVAVLFFRNLQQGFRNIVQIDLSHRAIPHNLIKYESHLLRASRPVASRQKD